MSQQRRRRFQPALEALEDRRVPTILILGDALYIEGGPGNDTVYVSYHSDSQYKVTFNNVDFFANKTDFDFIEFHGGWGDDYFENQINRKSWAYGDNGEDWLVGGPLQDHLYGGNDTDVLDGRGGHDHLDGGTDTDWNWLFGGDGKDTLIGANGNDVMEGGPRNDVLIGYEGNDLMSGGTGSDTLAGLEGDDWLYGNNASPGPAGNDGDVDVLMGGSGADHFRMEWFVDVFYDFDFSEGDTIYNP